MTEATTDYKTITYSKKLGACGFLYVIILEDEGVFQRLFIKGTMTKSTPCGESFFDPLAKILTFAIRRGIWEGETAIDQGIIKQLLNVRCCSVVPNKERVVSCSDAVGKCLKEYFSAKETAKV